MYQRTISSAGVENYACKVVFKEIVRVCVSIDRVNLLDRSGTHMSFDASITDV